MNENTPQQVQVVATERPQSGTVTALAVVSIIFGALGLLGSFVPCLGAFAIWIAVPAALFGAGAIYIAKSKGCSIGLPVAAFVVSALGVIISGTQILLLGGAIDAANKATEADIKARQEQIQDENNKQ